jgi:hypothetical protein
VVVFCEGDGAGDGDRDGDEEGELREEESVDGEDAIDGDKLDSLFTFVVKGFAVSLVTLQRSTAFLPRPFLDRLAASAGGGMYEHSSAISVATHREHGSSLSHFNFRG